MGNPTNAHDSTSPTTWELLWSLLEQVTDVQRLAEAKNGALMSVAGAALAVLSSFLLRTPPLPPTWARGLSAGAVPMATSLIVALASFLPATADRGEAGSGGRPSEGDNLCLYSDVSKYTARELLIALGHDACTTSDPVEKVHLNLAAQVTAMARIARKKLLFFRWAVYLFLLGILLVPAVAAGGS